MADLIYLDHNSTTPLDPRVAEALAAAQGLANPASQHRAGRRARQVLEDAREEIGRLLGASVSEHRGDRVIFTSGGTEANNLAIFGLGRKTDDADAGRLLVSAIEHPSVLGPADALAARGGRVERIGVDRDGVLRLDELAQRLNAERPPRLVSLMLGNNETGVVQPIAEAAQMSRERGALVHTDAVQAVGKLHVNFRELGVDALTATAHKFHGPRGVGVLVVRAGVDVQPLLIGGFQQAGLRPGTEPVALAVGMQAALRLAVEEAVQRQSRMAALRDRLEAGLVKLWPAAQVNGRAAPRLPHTANVAFPGLDRQALLMALDQAGVACSTGSACASGSSEPSHVLLAMGLAAGLVSSSLRFSLGTDTTEADIDAALCRFAALPLLKLA